jgi:putative DNA primase/helicase
LVEDAILDEPRAKSNAAETQSQHAPPENVGEFVGEFPALHDRSQSEGPAGAEPDALIAVESTEPLRLAEKYLERFARDDSGRLTLRRYRQEWWRFAGCGYRKVEDETQDAQMYEYIDRARVVVLDDAGQPIGTPAKIPAKAALVREVRLALPSRKMIIEGVMPQWLDGRMSPAPTDVVAFKNGLLDTAAYCRSGVPELIPPTPEWFSGVACPFDFDPKAKCPVWENFLLEAFEGDQESIDLLQEWFGYQLVPDNRYEALMMFVGKPRAGKGTTIEGLMAMLGSDQVASTNFFKLASRFGLHPLLGKLAAVMPDAHLSRSTDEKAALEVLKNISGNDAQAIDRKGVDELPHVWMPVRFTIATNELPKLPDEAGALKPRLKLLYYGRSMAGCEDSTLKPRVRAEAPGIAVWALRGLDRLRENGAFTEPARCKAMVEEFEKLVSPVKSFVSERCELSHGDWIAKDDLYNAWKEWCEERGDTPGSKPQFGQQLINAYSEVTSGRLGPRGQQFTAYRGIRLCA